MNTSQGVIILGGVANAISLARSFGRYQIPVYFRHSTNSLVLRSKYVTPIKFDCNVNTRQDFERFLLNDASSRFHGSTLLACSDSGIEFLIDNKALLEKTYIIDIMNPQAQRILLNKRLTYRSASAIGIPTPQYWEFSDYQEAISHLPQIHFPVLLKPEYTHTFVEKYKCKYLTAHNAEELKQHLKLFEQINASGVILEFIPGPDSLLCSYYTYIDADGNPLFDFTKRIIRRYPKSEGNGCYHITDDVPKVKELSLKLFEGIGLLGVANAEFKKDVRTGELKLIECNARFTAANCLLYDSGIDLPMFVYNRLNNLPTTTPSSFRVGKRLWYPIDDFASFFELNKYREISFGDWVRSILHPQTFPYFRWNDPLPSLANLFTLFLRFARKGFKLMSALLSPANLLIKS